MANEVYQLVVRKGPRPGQVFPLELDVLTLGRDPIADIVLEDPEVSRHHAKLTQIEAGYQLQDMGSTNGTFVDGQRLAGEAQDLKPGQVVMLGSNVTLVYQAAPASDPLATMVAPAAAVEHEVPAPDPELETPAEEPDVEIVVEPELDKPPVVEPVEVDLVDETPESVPEVDEEDALETMYEEQASVIEAAEVETDSLPTFDEPLPDPDQSLDFETPAPVATFDEPVPEPEPEPDYETPSPLPSFEEPEPPPVFDDIAQPVEDNFDQTIVDSGEPLPDFEAKPIGGTALEEPADYAAGKGDSTRNRNIIIAVVVVLLLCCCCLLILGAVALSQGEFDSVVYMERGLEIASTVKGHLLF